MTIQMALGGYHRIVDIFDVDISAPASSAPSTSQPEASLSSDDPILIDQEPAPSSIRRGHKTAMTEAKQKELQAKYPWCRFSGGCNEKGTPQAHCSTCLEHKPNSSLFAKASGGGGAVTCEAELAQHAKSKAHSEAIGMAQRAGGGAGSIKAAVKAATTTVVQGTYRRMVLAALFMVLWGHSAMSFAAHLQFATHSGAPAMPHDFSATRYFNAALYSISQTLLTQQLAAVRASPYFSLLADSSTDVGTEDHLLLYVRYLEPSSFIYHTSFLCAVKVVGATSEHNTAVILRVIDTLSLDVGKLVAFCSDGASTFMGAHNRVIAKLQQQHVSYMVGVHCVAHRTTLVVGDAFRVSPLMQQLDSALKGVHSLFAKSPKWQGRWEAFAKPLGVTLLKFPIFNRTRWFSRAQCVSVLVANYHTLLRFLNLHPEWVVGRSLLTRLQKFRTLAGLHLLHDMMQPLEQLSKLFQSDALEPHMLASHVAIAKAALEQLFIRSSLTTTIPLPDCRHSVRTHMRAKHKLGLANQDSIYYQMSQDIARVAAKGSCERVMLDPGIPTAAQRTALLYRTGGLYNQKLAMRWGKAADDRCPLCGEADSATHLLSGCTRTAALVQERHNGAGRLITKAINQRFPSSILNSFAIFVPRSYVGMVAAELVAYGQQELQELVKHFCNASQRQQLFRVEGTAGVARLVQQLTFFKREMWRVVQANRSVTLQSAWVQLMELGYVHFPLMMQLAQIMLLVPLQTAVVERGFSIHRIIKHRLTNRLKLATVDSLMRIRLIGPSKHTYQKEEALIAHAASAMDEILKLKAAGKPEGILAALSEAALPLEVEQPNVPLDLEGDMEEVESLWGEESDQEECEHESSDEVDEALFGTEAGGVPEDTFEASLLAAVR
ncbi:hypothetical protein QJQ45_001026 [Haematococcus lacustris]|nr:hypothetical protein QJQ45_001026 [Haematococcus lacustris]